MPLLGYARVSTDEQATSRQLDELRAAGCAEVAEEHASGADRDRPVLARALARLRPGDTLVVVSLDRLARSLSHLLEVVEALGRRGVHFRSLRDPVDTASPQGLFTMQVLGAAAQLERALIRERTRSGMRAAAARGSRPGNPGLRDRDPAALRRASEARRAAYLAGVAAGSDAWLPAVRALRGAEARRPWGDVARYLNALGGAAGPRWTEERLVRAVRRLAEAGLAEAELLEAAPRAPAPDRLLAVVAGIVASDPGASLRTIGSRLEAIRQRTPRGLARWAPGSVSHVLARARRAGLVP